jgi:hypothetical protein
MIKLIMILFLIFLSGQPAFSQTLGVSKITGDRKEVVLFDQDTGQEWVAKKGEKVGDWRVVEITQSHVKLARLGENNTVYVTTIPIPAKQRMIIEAPK